MRGTLCASLLILLSACASLNREIPVAVAPTLPPIPVHLANCFSGTVDLPEGDWTNAEVVEILAMLRASELQKNRCGRELIAFYEQLAEDLRTEE